MHNVYDVAKEINDRAEACYAEAKAKFSLDEYQLKAARALATVALQQIYVPQSPMGRDPADYRLLIFDAVNHPAMRDDTPLEKLYADLGIAPEHQYAFSAHVASFMHCFCTVADGVIDEGQTNGKPAEYVHAIMDAAMIMMPAGLRVRKEMFAKYGEALACEAARLQIETNKRMREAQKQCAEGGMQIHA